MIKIIKVALIVLLVFLVTIGILFYFKIIDTGTFGTGVGLAKTYLFGMKPKKEND